MTENHMPIGRETLLLPKPDKISSNVMFQPPKTGMLVYMCRYTYIYIYIYRLSYINNYSLTKRR